MANYISSKETWYDEDKQLYYKYIGRDNKKKTLMYTAWGHTAQLAEMKAELVITMLNELNIENQ